MIPKTFEKEDENVEEKRTFYPLMIETLFSVQRYSAFTLTWIIVNDFQVEYLFFQPSKTMEMDVCKKDIIQVRMERSILWTFLFHSYNFIA